MADDYRYQDDGASANGRYAQAGRRPAAGQGAQQRSYRANAYPQAERRAGASRHASAQRHNMDIPRGTDTSYGAGASAGAGAGRQSHGGYSTNYAQPIRQDAGDPARQYSASANASRSNTRRTPYGQEIGHTTARRASVGSNNPYSRSQANYENRGGHRTNTSAYVPAGSGDTSQYGEQNYLNRPKKKKNPIGIVIACVLIVVIAVGVYLFINPLSYEVTINGVKQTVSSGTTIAQAIDKGMASPKAGNLLDIDGGVITEGGGNEFVATFSNGEQTSDGSRVLTKNDVVSIGNGTDVTEDSTVTTEDVPYSSGGIIGTGAIHLYVDGVNGTKTVTTGNISGKTKEEITQQPVNECVVEYNAHTGDDKVIALTFDDGPWPTTTNEILDILKQYNVKATFFTIGEQIASYSDSVLREVAEGHEVCTHTHDHASGSGQGVNLTYMSAEEQIWEVDQGFADIEAVTGTPVSPRIMRAPGGNYYGTLVETLRSHIVADINWNIDTEDWSKPGVDAIIKAAESAASGDIILCHDGGGDRSQTVEALKTFIPYLLEQGYTFVTIDELLAYPIPDSVYSSSTSSAS